MSANRRLIGVRPDERGRIEPVFADAADALGHHRAVVDALRTAPMMPLAFGADGGRLSNIRRWLAERQDMLAAEFTRSRDLVEMGLHIVCEPEPEIDAAAESGRDFLRRVREKAIRSDRLRARVEAIVAAAGDSPGVVRWRVLADDGHVVSAALAVRRDAGARIAATLGGMSGDGVTVETSGPWPLYSFGLRDILERESAA